MILALWLGLGAAWAEAPGAFAGSWGLDPARSDDPAETLQRRMRGPLYQGGPARDYSPDGVGDDGIDQRQQIIDQTLLLLALSGRLSLSAGDEGTVVLEYGGEPPIPLVPDGRWVKLKRPDRTVWKVRLREEDDRLVIQRRVQATWVSETLLPPTEPDTLVVVVQVDGTGLDPAVEFRRIYHRLDAGAE